MRRRGLLAGLGALFAGGCSKVADSGAGRALLDAADGWHKDAQRLITGRDALVPEFDRSQISPFFRGNGSIAIDTPSPVYSLIQKLITAPIGGFSPRNTPVVPCQSHPGNGS